MARGRKTAQSVRAACVTSATFTVFMFFRWRRVS